MRLLKELMNMEGRVALITGGAGHLGSSMAAALAELGATVVVLDVDTQRCETVANQLKSDFSVETFPLAVDLSDSIAVSGVPQRVIEQCGRLDVIVHSAGYGGDAKMEGWAVPFEQQSVAAWEKALSVNLTAAFVLVKEAKNALVESGHGSVIFISSIYGVVAPDWSLYEGTSMANPTAYGASKGGLLQLMRYLATLLAPAVRVNAISPGGVWRDYPESFHQRYRARTPAGRMGTEEDIKGAVAYLASDLSNYVTGHNLMLDGGFTAW
jgi:NAD(P)-dependent dehydrogenase (short-subunit alcohol dehydrogenase family)